MMGWTSIFDVVIGGVFKIGVFHCASFAVLRPKHRPYSSCTVASRDKKMFISSLAFVHTVDILSPIWR